MGKRTNQNFVHISHKKLIDMTRYKAEEYGITEEYTSSAFIFIPLDASNSPLKILFPI